MGGEWSLGVALVIEIWPERWRTLLAGCIGAAANVGFLGVGLLSLVLGSFVESIESMLLALSLPETWVRGLMAHSGWRFLMILGALPAGLVFLIRLFVPESERWLEERNKGATTHWETSDLLGVLAGCAGSCLVIAVWSPLVANHWIRLVATAAGLLVAVWGFMFPARQYLRRAARSHAITAADRALILRRMLLGAGLAGVALLGTWGSVQWAPKWASELAGEAHPFAKEYTQISIGAAAIISTILAALMGGWLGRRVTYMLLCAGTIGAALLFYLTNQEFGAAFLVTAFLLGGVSASFYGFFPLYFPELFPTRVRATGQGFAFNFGRIVAAVGSLQTATLIGFFDGDFPKAGSVMCAIYLIGIALVWLGPETKGKPLPE
jgi:MFS transporter, SHS family, sialic acid transporter